MMRWKYILLLLCCLAGGLPLQAQAAKKGRQQPDYLQQLEQARKLNTSNPEGAIKVLEGVIIGSRKAGDKASEAESYYLLGGIYENIHQPELALKRYQQAYYLLGAIARTPLRAQNYSRMGSLQLKLGQFAASEKSFNLCLSDTKDPELVGLCREGLAKLAVASGQPEQGLRMYDTLEHLYTRNNDSLSLSRIEAQRSQAYLTQQDREQARQSYDKSLNSIPRQNRVAEDYLPIQEAKQALEADNLSDSEQIELSLNTLQSQQAQQAPPEVLVDGQMQLASLYLEKGDLSEAGKYVEASKALLGGKVSPAKRAEVYKTASELSLKKGAYSQAAKEYQQYIAENEQVLHQKQQELARQAAILKNQSDIDLLIKDFALQETEKALLNNRIRIQQVTIASLALLLLAAAFSLYFIMKNVRARRRANQLLLLKSLRTQMNPHFLFNALNSVNHFISQNDERAANKFLADFARLMRLVLDHSQKDFISLEEELEVLELYLKLEHQRFQDKFDYTIDKDKDITYTGIEIPPMLLQPFVENAIWHGLRYKAGKGRLTVALKRVGEELVASITDDGIGRSRSLALKTRHQSQYQSTGLQNVHQRITALNQAYGKRYRLDITDASPGEEDCGTSATLYIPLNP